MMVELMVYNFHPVPPAALCSDHNAHEGASTYLWLVYVTGESFRNALSLWLGLSTNEATWPYIAECPLAHRLITERSKEVIQASQPGTPHNLSRPVSMPELLIDLPGEREPLMSSEDECAPEPQP